MNLRMKATFQRCGCATVSGRDVVRRDRSLRKIGENTFVSKIYFGQREGSRKSDAPAMLNLPKLAWRPSETYFTACLANVRRPSLDAGDQRRIFPSRQYQQLRGDIDGFPPGLSAACSAEASLIPSPTCQRARAFRLCAARGDDALFFRSAARSRRKRRCLPRDFAAFIARFNRSSPHGCAVADTVTAVLSAYTKHLLSP